jgi:BirA family biotin operon repressor/biotin-[acetyl-CoA-carboxylase] ligase
MTDAPAEQIAIAATSWEGRTVDEWRTLWELPELHVFDTVGSTNDAVRTRADAGAPAGTTAIADIQTRGRGRRSRAWTAPSEKALLFSTLIRPATSSPAEFAGTIPLRVGMAIARAIEDVTGIALRLKWPNDVLTRDGRKLAGILCESMLSPTALSYTVVGVGINVLQVTADFDDDIRATAASLAMLTRTTPDRARLASACIRELRPLLDAAVKPLSEREQDEYARRDALAGLAVAVDGKPAGTAHGVSASGGLNVFAANERRLIHSGTVRVVA